MEDENVTGNIPAKTAEEPKKEDAPAAPPAEAPAETITEEPPLKEAAEHKGKSLQDRIDQITREKYEARRETEDARREAEHYRNLAIKGSGQPTEGNKPSADLKNLKEPKPDEFPDGVIDPNYVKAVTSWQLDIREREKQAEFLKADMQRQREAAARNFSKNAAEYAKEVPDFDAVAKNPNLVRHYGDHMVDAIEGSNYGAQIAYFLGKNPEEAFRIASLPPIEGIKEIGKIEFKLSEAPKPKNISKAPEPITPLGGGGGVINTDESKLSGREWMERRNRGEIK